METFDTSYGLITLYKNETFIINHFTPLLIMYISKL